MNFAKLYEHPIFGQLLVTIDTDDEDNRVITFRLNYNDINLSFDVNGLSDDKMNDMFNKMTEEKALSIVNNSGVYKLLEENK